MNSIFDYVSKERCSIIEQEVGGRPLRSKNVDIHNQVKAMIASQGWTLTRVVQKMNERRLEQDRTTIQNISNKLTRGTIKYSEILEIAEIIGIDILWEPRAPQ